MSASRQKPTSGGKSPATQSFTLHAPGVQCVELVGDFTDWEAKPIRLRAGARGIWRARVALPPGNHQYRFRVDGEWRDDPAAAVRVPNPFGGENAVRVVV